MRNRGPVSWYHRFERHARRTVAEAGAKYLEAYPGKDKQRVGYALKALIPYVGDLFLMDLNDDALSQYRHDRANGLGAFSVAASAGTINYEIDVLSTIMNAACSEWEWIPRALKLKRVRGPRKQAYPLTWEQQDALFAKLPQHWADGVALFGFNTGLREDELVGLRWEQRVMIPDLKSFVFVLSATKNGEARAVVCNSLARLAVERQEGNGSDYVFPSRSNRSKGERVAKLGNIWWEAWEAAGLPTGKWTRQGPHNMRHTYSHRLRVAGVSEEDRDALLGHKRASLSQHYAQPDLERLQGLAELATHRVLGGVILRRVVA